MKFILISIFAIFPIISISQTTPSWPGTQMGSDVFESPELEFRGSLLSFRNTATNLYYIAFDGNLVGTSTEYDDGIHSLFVLSAEDKSSVAAVYTAYSMGSKFKIQYKKDNFMNRNILEVKVFKIQK